MSAARLFSAFSTSPVNSKSPPRYRSKTLVTVEAGARAQFMFQNGQGERLTLYIGAVGAQSSGSGETAFRFTREGPAASFYWVDKGFGYALSGNLPRERLLALADTVYRQLAGSPPARG